MSRRYHRRRASLRARILITLLVFMALGALAELAGQLTRESVAGVFQAVDGDTLSQAGRRLRFSGIDAPELAQVCMRGKTSWRCGADAKAVLARMASSGHLVCAGVGEDRYGRLLVECRDAEGDVNARLVAQGWAVSFGRYAAEERQARVARRGIWSGEFERPADWRERHARDGETPHVAQSAAIRFFRDLARLAFGMVL